MKKKRKKKKTEIPGSYQRPEKKAVSMRLTVISFVVGALGTVSKGLKKKMKGTVDSR